MIKTEIVDRFIKEHIGAESFSKEELLRFKKQVDEVIDKEHREYFHKKIDELLAGD